MKKFDYYKEDTSTDYVWYDSSNLHYSQATENQDGTINLYIVFNNGAAYIYYKVDMNDYLYMKQSESNGLAFSTLIAKKIEGKPKYEYKRLSDANIAELDAMMVTVRNKAFEEKEAEMENKAEELKEAVKEVKESHTGDKIQHKVDIKCDETFVMHFFVDGEEISSIPCVNQNGYMRFALFLAPIMSYLGCPLKIGVGE